MPTNYERSYWPAGEIRVSRNGDQPQIEWYAAVFDSWSEDMWGMREKVNRRAFTKTIKESDIRALLNHDPNFVLGRNTAGTLRLHVDHTGLRATVDVPDVQWARDLATSVERGDITAGSFGFRVIEDKWAEEPDGTFTRELREVQLFDVSIVTYPAYPGTDGSAAVRALAGIVNLDALTHPLIKLRAGLPLGDDERGRVEGVIAQLRQAIPTPAAPPEEKRGEEPVHEGPDPRLGYYDKTLTFWRLRGAAPKE